MATSKPRRTTLLPTTSPKLSIPMVGKRPTAWLNLFPAITVIPSASLRAGLCLLHAFLKIRDRCQRMTEHVAEIYTRVWEAYHRGDLWSCG